MTAIDNLMRIGGTAVLRNPGLDTLDRAQLKRFAPTLFAKRGIEGVSDNYGFVSTIGIIDAMAENGYECVEVRQSQRRDEDRMPFTKHMVKFRHPGTLKALLKRGDVIPQIVMLNSHDRSSGFQLYAGMFRVVCSNGLIVSDSQLVEPIRVRHSTRMVEDILKRSLELVKGADGVYTLRDEMLHTAMTQKTAIAFANEALQFRPPRRSGLMTPDSLLEVRRTEDAPLDLWHVFNRVQENMLRGGVTTVTEGVDGKAGRSVQTKGIGRIERDVQVNSALWGLAVETLAKASKSAAKATAKTATKEAPAKPARSSRRKEVEAELDI